MLDKNKTYLVLNYNGSPVAVSTRHESYIIPGGSSESPSSMPLSVDEIVQINSNSNVFKMGLLWFEEEFQEDLYKECRIRNWKNILTDSEIEDIQHLKSLKDYYQSKTSSILSVVMVFILVSRILIIVLSRMLNMLCLLVEKNFVTESIKRVFY